MGFHSRAKFVLVLMVCLVFAPPPSSRGQRTVVAINVSEAYLKTAADQERASLGLPQLRWNDALAAAAREHASLMVRHNSISHQYAGEPDLAQRGAAAGAKFSLISENVAESPSAVKIHTAWMHSEGHRHNLLDPNVDSVGIAVIARGRQLFAVEDFERSLQPMSLKQQEDAVAAAITPAKLTITQGDAGARRTCMQETGLAAGRQPAFVMRYTTADLGRLPEELRSRLATGKYSTATVAACPANDGGSFSMYRIAVLLYP